LCELFAVSALESKDRAKEVKEFFTHSVRHPHGWGMAMFYDLGAVAIEKEPLPAYESAYLKARLSQKIVVPSMLAHIRYATIGRNEYGNTHPFVDRDASSRCWTLIHNGTIFDYPPLKPYLDRQDGGTDSEAILCYLVDQINQETRKRQKNLNAKERFHLIDKLIVPMAAGNKLNLIFYDEEIMYVHTNFKDSLYYCEKEDSTFFCTVPLEEGEWKAVPFMELLAYRNGKLWMRGSRHENEFFDDPEKRKWLYMDFASL
jgi:predicted glutamine amidotransferase